MSEIDKEIPSQPNSRSRLSGRLEFLQLAAPEILVPAEVAAEIRQYDADDPAVQALEGTPWLKMVEVPAVPSRIQAWDLGPGESSVLAYAMAHRPMIAIIDGLSARHCAEVFRIPVNGTLGLVLTAKKRGVIPLARPALEQLRQSGMYLRPNIRCRWNYPKCQRQFRAENVGHRKAYLTNPAWPPYAD